MPYRDGMLAETERLRCERLEMETEIKKIREENDRLRLKLNPPKKKKGPTMKFFKNIRLTSIVIGTLLVGLAVLMGAATHSVITSKDDNYTSCLAECKKLGSFIAVDWRYFRSRKDGDILECECVPKIGEIKKIRLLSRER